MIREPPVLTFCLNLYRKLGRPSAHRKSMLRNLVTDLFREGRIQTTDCRAKEARRIAEKMITLAKRGDLHALVSPASIA